MTDALLATDNEQPQDATTTPGEVANVDPQPAPDPQQAQAEPQDTTPTETKPETDKAEDKPEGAPDRYTFERPEEMPEDFELDKEVEGALADVSRELDLSQGNAQKLLSKVWPVMHRVAEEQQNAINDQWIAEVKADPEIGGQKFDESKAQAQRAVNAYGGDELRELLQGPIGSHPGLFRLLAKVGETVSEDKFVGGNQTVPAVDLNDEAAVAKALYPTSPQ